MLAWMDPRAASPLPRVPLWLWPESFLNPGTSSSSLSPAQSRCSPPSLAGPQVTSCPLRALRGQKEDWNLPDRHPVPWTRSGADSSRMRGPASYQARPAPHCPVSSTLGPGALQCCPPPTPQVQGDVSPGARGSCHSGQRGACLTWDSGVGPDPRPSPVHSRPPPAQNTPHTLEPGPGLAKMSSSVSPVCLLPCRVRAAALM